MPDETPFVPAQLAYPPLYQEFALSELGAQYGTATLKVLVNPSWRFRREFISSCYDGGQAEWLRHVATILDVPTREALSTWMDEADPIVMQRLLLPKRIDDANVIGKFKVEEAFIVTIWDRFRETLIKGVASL